MNTSPGRLKISYKIYKIIFNSNEGLLENIIENELNTSYVSIHWLTIVVSLIYKKGNVKYCGN